MAEPVPPHLHFIDGVATRDVTINPTSGLRVRIYKPKQDSENQTKLPILIHFHGGGFCISEASWFMYYSIYAKLAKSVPAIVVSVYLRLAPEHRLPAACDDGFEALLWLRGDSSGGNVVHEVAARAGHVLPDMGPLKLAGAIPIHPGFVRAERSKSELEQPESPFLTLDMVDKFLKLALPLKCTKDHPLTCPMGAAAPPFDGLKLPPFLLCVAENDLIKDTEMEYYEAMKKAGKEVELFMNYGMGHSFYLNKIAVDMDPKTGAQTYRLLQGISEFIRNH
ncbi:hypothetical protein Patl1_05714 [Pistacia atlantica]|uniref:Uncharacterized protein n=1 Tax=Pistacia atlantica TaxID=434234 RepID=A0ACC1BT36_9ROSI|nr:hypothetical protein Patl1_05714 [Pistacia atlantica]